MSAGGLCREDGQLGYIQEQKKEKKKTGVGNIVWLDSESCCFWKA
jgi:hypothetical protein